MRQYLNDLKFIMENGTDRQDRTGTGTRGVFGLQSRYNLQEAFPAVTTKRLAWKAVVSELLWFIEGSDDERRLAEILHGTRDPEKKTIWTGNAQAEYWKPKARFEGDLGRVYGVQWREWQTPVYVTPQEVGYSWNEGHYVVETVDQLANLIEGIKNNPYDRRHILTAWNPGELDTMALPPCHCFAQFYVANGKLSCQMYQRSADFGLGVPFNIASYSLLTHMIAQVCGLDVGEFIHTIGDAHIYNDHMDAVKEQLTREPLPLPKLWLNPDIKNIDDFTIDDIKMINYQSHSTIRMNMAV